MSSLIFVVSVRRNLGVCGLFLGIHELMRFLCPKLGEDRKKSLHPEMEWFLCPILREDQQKKVFSLNWSGFRARKVYCLFCCGNFVINNNMIVSVKMSVRSKFMRVRSL